MQRLVFYLICGYCVLSRTRGTHHKHGAREETTYKHGTKHITQNGSSCDDSFHHHLDECLEPFSKKAHIYTSIYPQNPIVREIFVKYVCRRYKKMLHCIHLVLTNCETVENIEIVQHKLDKRRWVVDVNDMCHIQSDSSKKNSTDTKERNYKKHSSESKGHNSGNYERDIKMHNSRYKGRPSITSVQPFNRVSESVTQSEIEYYNMKSQEAAENLPRLKNSNRRNSHENIPNIVQKLKKEEFQKLSNKIVQSDRIGGSSKTIAQLVTYIQYNVFLNGQKDSEVKVDKHISTDTSSLDTLLEDGQKPVMVHVLYIDSDKGMSSHSVSGGCLLLCNPVVVVCLILTVISTQLIM